MTKQRESRQVSKKVQAELKRRGWFCFKVWGNEHMMVGLPDIVACVNGRFLGLECKLPESRDNVSPRQAWVGNLIRKSGGRFEVVCSVTEAIRVIGELEDC